MSPLAGLHVLDCTNRLPGPLAGMLLRRLGAHVTKVEPTQRPDPFLDPFFARYDDVFLSWYHELNRDKLRVEVDINNADDELSLRQLIRNSDIILMSAKSEHFLSLLQEEAKLEPRAQVVLLVSAHPDQQTPMHDLNALAESGLLQMHVAHIASSPYPPPFMPIAGVSFGQQIALSALAFHRQAQIEKTLVISEVFLAVETQQIFRPFLKPLQSSHERRKFLHNGKFPCYSLYRTKDGHWLAVATVEERFWLEFISILELELTANDRFSESLEVFRLLSQTIASKTRSELTELIGEKKICVSFVQ